ncbi:MAG: M28 family peptidase [Alphaproteobacteria bacterium]|nr:M28 family peptidase [Alphaproteobacteria bacterium]
MRKSLGLIALSLAGLSISASAQQPAKPLYVLEDSYLRWRLLPEEQAYLSIDGKHLKQYVEGQTAISRRYRDHGHPQFWGRISGTEADAENAQWLLDNFRKIGLSDVHEQPLDLPPQWVPESWSVAASAGGKTVTLESAQPTSTSPGTPQGGLDLEAVDVALASEGDLAGRDLHGKAVFFYSADYTSRQAPISDYAIKRIGERGAAAIFVIVGLPGNLKTQFYPVGSTVPTFSLGLQDGNAIRDLIGKSRGGQPARVKIRLDVKNVPNLKTATVWGSLPGTSDESIFVVAHRDAWFEGATDNASGVATMLGLAEYFAKIPKEQRRRTIYFLGTSGHHDNSGMTGHWLAGHKELFARTALIINCEHTSAEQLVYRGGSIRRSNTTVPLRWYVGGSAKLEQIAVRAYDMFGVATYAQPEPAAGGEMAPYYQLAPSLQLIEGNLYWHSDRETADYVPPTGLAASTRAYAKIITDVNQLDLKDLQRPPAKQVQR